MNPPPRLHWPPPAAARGLIDAEEGIERVLGDHDMYARLLQRFIKDYGAGLAPVAAALAAHDAERAHRYIHSLKGAAGMLGARALHLAAAAADQQLLARSPTLDAALDAVDTQLAPVLVLMAQMIEEPVSVLTYATPAADGLLAELARLLEAGDGAACDLFEAEAAALEARLGAAEFAALSQAIERFDFPGARQRLGAY
ncbi:Hpt domain-containing protein [Massilia sp. TS11]|uniref:Hpt domain-containing protein n=1 Tax=Massilia sp. TS11 TaxID=2908003 RepID=UPI001EDA389F|nr:Hpt domain-containing protein [Massilia sp. TS11]MCG2586610.1 Hpt domain-containing protein [Massilia sp. TS11]